MVDAMMKSSTAHPTTTSPSSTPTTSPWAATSGGSAATRARCPHEHNNDGKGDRISFFVELRSRSPPKSGIKAFFQAFAVVAITGTQALTTSVQVYPPEFAVHAGCHRLYERTSDLRPLCDDGRVVTIVCGVIVLGSGGGAIDVPPSDVVAHLGGLLESGAGSDVSFVVGRDTFRAHRAVLAARSPVFRAELFIYRDALPDDDELCGGDDDEESPMEMFQHLLAAADRYALDRLKLICTQKIWEHVTVDTVAYCFKLDFAGTQKLGIGDIVYSDDISAGGHIWRVHCYPHGNKKGNNGVSLSVFLELVSKSKNIKAIFDAFLMGKDGQPSSSIANRCVKAYPPEGFVAWGFSQFAKRTDLESGYMTDGYVTFIFGVVVLRDNPISVPSSDIGDHLGRLLVSSDGSDVMFSVSSETFRAHRAVLAARSPVFKAQLFGPMKDAKAPCIELPEIKPATFKILLQFMYTDALPGDDELKGSSIVELFQNLLAAADMYHLDRLKLMCAQKLWEHLSADSVATVLGCAEKHNCAERRTGAWTSSSSRKISRMLC
ncbi:hypothetical protein PR202_gb02618 [Eleusine coracana subsp. coracana]|uniref:BTB domain-containing protein n=1 Tax=Eleusine coracana subsp. coracana TaxID=191504 RepID=A0AAV5DYY8_ELECO|nr:hypothetical protein PR202_gb02618 [Eleusine coracana subsp. coracana]